MSKRIGVFGGTFAPFHVGHRWIVQAFIDEYCLDELHIIPTIVNYHRVEKDTMLEIDKRFVLERVLQSLPYYYASRIKIDYSEWRYRDLCRGMTDAAWGVLVNGRRFIHTLLDFCGRNGFAAEDIEAGWKPYVCLGTDSFDNLDKWYLGGEIPKICHVIAVQGRDDKVVKGKMNDGELWIPSKFRGVSASKIRKAMLGRDWTHYLEDVEKFDKGEKTAKELGWA